MDEGCDYDKLNRYYVTVNQVMVATIKLPK